MSKSLTAEEFIDSFKYERDGISYNLGEREWSSEQEDEIIRLMVGFAKIHTKKALEEASRKAKLKPRATWSDGINGIIPKIDNNSILNAYSIEEIS